MKMTKYFNSIMPKKYPVSLDEIITGMITMGFKDE